MRKDVRHLSVFVSCLIVSAFLMAAVPASAVDIPQIAAAEVKKMIEAKRTDILIVDVQPKGVYDVAHVKGAVNFPWDSDLKDSGNLPKDKLLIFYCDCSHEEDSTDAATQLMEKFGYTNIKLLEGGWSNWQKLEYPVDKK